ncbi:hypothetical protein TcYC6_0125520 [Trypanosoma cruzi]|nr:hypothetical protein TcYC6_0125520 [Trypanosoma cruzi]
MKLIILGGPVVGKINVDVTPDKPFGEVFALIQAAVDKGALWDKFQLNVAEVRDRKVRATTRVIQSTDTAESLGLSSDAAVLILRPLDRNMSGGPTVADRVTDTNSTPPTSTQCDYRSRMIAIYQKYEPSKVGTVDASLQKFKGKEEAVIRQLVKKYGPEPPVSANTPSGNTPGPQSALSPVSPLPPAAAPEVAAASPVVESSSEPAEKSYRSRMIAIYQKYEPSKVGTVDASLQKFKGKEEAVIRQLVKKYGPEPDAANTDSPQFPPNNDVISPIRSIKPQTFQDAETREETPVSPHSNPQSAGVIHNSASPLAPTNSSKTVGDVLLEPSRENLASIPSTALKDANKMQVESYGLQSFISPTDHEPLVEPLSEADGNSTVVEGEQGEGTTKADENKGLRIPKNLSFGTAAAIIGKDVFDTTKPMLRDLARSLPSRRRGQNDILEGGCVSIITNNRFQGVVKRAVETLCETAANMLRRVYWRRWQYKVARKLANNLIEERVWMRTRGGARLVDSVPHTFDVPSLEDYVYEKRVCTRERNADFSDDLQRALRELLYTAKHHLVEANDPEDTPFIFDKDLCPVRDTKELAAALCLLKNMIIDFSETKSIVNLRERELSKLRDTNEVLRRRLEEAETSLSHLTQVGEEMAVVQAQCDKLKEKLGQAEEGWKNAKYQLQFLQRELKKERNQPPSNAEQLLQRKDNEVVSLQRELSKLRTKLHREVKEKESLESQLKEVKAEAVCAAQKLEKWVSSGALASRGRSAGALASQLNLPRGFFSSGFLQTMKTEKIRDEEYLPLGVAEDAREVTSLVGRTSQDIVRENLRLEVELRQNEAVPEEIEFGNCPHCRRRLTSCSATPTGPPGKKAAFCFSCRRSYTFGDLTAREKLSAVPLMKRWKDPSPRSFVKY